LVGCALTVVSAVGIPVRVAVFVRVDVRLAVEVRVGKTPESKRIRGGPCASRKDSQPVWTVPSGFTRTLAQARNVTARSIPYSG
jgi:hypothetical protein